MKWFKKIKQFAWFVFKSPQRSIVGFNTLFTDIKGFVFTCFSSQKEQILWVCVGNYNRTQNIKTILIPSLKNIHGGTIGLSIVDTGSQDWEPFCQWLKSNWNGPIITQQINKPFARAWAFNAAIAQCPGNFVAVVDADIELPNNYYKLAVKNTSTLQAWFPVCQWQLEPNIDQWRWFTEGTGVFCAYKTQIEIAGFYNEAITSWGKEDWQLFFAFYQKGIKAYRSNCGGLKHHWHPSLKPVDFEKWF